MSEEHIIQFDPASLSDLLNDESYWQRLDALSDEEITARALTDPDNPPLTEQQLSRMKRVLTPQQIRHQLAMTQEQFARTFKLSLATLRDWEQGRTRPDRAARAFLKVIAYNPEFVKEALAA